MNEDQVYDAAEREMDLYRNEVTRLRAAHEADIASLTDQRNRVSETADQLREQLDATKAVLQETSRESSQRGARADEFARVKVRLCALIASLDETVERGTHAEEFDQGAAHASAVTARQLREILDDTALGTTPTAAPELAAAMGVLRRVLEWFPTGGTRNEASATRAQLASAYLDGGLNVPEELRKFLGKRGGQ